LRKDFPLSGYVEIYYDDIEKKIIFKKIDLSQEFKNFIFKKT
jgi:NADH-quinone oxidoreductase subunit C